MGKRHPLRTTAALAWLPLLAVAGCSGPTVETSNPGNLEKIQRAYLEATDEQDRPPDSQEEFEPFLEKYGDVASLLRSPNDGQPYVILYGTDPRAHRSATPGVVGYEQQGSGGRRFVFTAMGIMQMDEEAFRNANFPQGHDPFSSP